MQIKFYRLIRIRFLIVICLTLIFSCGDKKVEKTNQANNIVRLSESQIAKVLQKEIDDISETLYYGLYFKDKSLSFLLILCIVFTFTLFK